MNSSTCKTHCYFLLAASLLAASSQIQARSFKMVQLSAVPEPTSQQASVSGLAGQKFDQNMNRCVELTVLTQQSNAGPQLQAQSACHQAVIEARNNARSGGNSRTLTAYAYTNRGVQKLQQSDKTGALADFQTAVKLQANAITEHNLRLLNQQLNRSD